MLALNPFLLALTLGLQISSVATILAAACGIFIAVTFAGPCKAETQNEAADTFEFERQSAKLPRVFVGGNAIGRLSAFGL